MVPFRVIHILEFQKLYITDLKVLLARAVARKAKPTFYMLIYIFVKQECHGDVLKCHFRPRTYIGPGDADQGSSCGDPRLQHGEPPVLRPSHVL